MNPDQLIKHFDRISEAPDAIPKLRQFILDLAVRGKLVEQDPDDEPASELIKRIAVERARLLKAGAVRKLPNFPRIQGDEIPFPIPPGWETVRMGWLARKLGAGSTPLGGKSVYQQEGVPFLRSQNVYNDGLRLDDVALISRLIHERMAGTHVKPADILLNITGASIGRSAIVAETFTEGNVSQHVAIVRLFDTSIRSFIHLSLISPFFQKVIDDVQVGVSREGLSMQRLSRFPMLIPPLAEQQRIVTTVDELMALCDRLDLAKAERENRRDTLVAASLHHLINGQNTEDFREHAFFYLNHLPSLTGRVEHIQSLRQTILSLAVRGKLVAQDDSEPAAKLLEFIQLQKEQLIKKGLLRKERPLRQVATEEMPFQIPQRWSWTRIGICSLATDYGTSVKSDALKDGVPVLKMGDIQDGKVILGAKKTVPRQIEDLPQLFLRRFDLLYNRTNSAELVGKTGIYLGADDEYTFASYLIRIRFLLPLTNPEYVNIAMNAPYFRATQIVPELQQQCGQANVNGSKLRNMAIPFPPVAEQHRIVSKVHELMTLCDQLEARLSRNQKENGCLLDAILHVALQNRSFQAIPKLALTT